MPSPSLPLALVFAIEFTTPLWTVLIAPFLLGEKLTKGRVITVLVGFAGIMLIVRPGRGTRRLGHVGGVRRSTLLRINPYAHKKNDVD